MTQDEGSTIADSARAALDEIAELIAATDTSALGEVAAEIDAAGRVFFAASGRSQLMLRAVAMRLMHIGLRTYIVGDTTTPAVSAGDVVVVASARGGSAALAVAHTAREAGARVAAVSASDDAFRDAADVVLPLPARTSVASAQHAGSLFEQTLLVVGDAITRRVQSSRGVSAGELHARHANL